VRLLWLLVLDFFERRSNIARGSSHEGARVVKGRPPIDLHHGRRASSDRSGDHSRLDGRSTPDTLHGRVSTATISSSVTPVENILPSAAVALVKALMVTIIDSLGCVVVSVHCAGATVTAVAVDNGRASCGDGSVEG